MKVQPQDGAPEAGASAAGETPAPECNPYAGAIPGDAREIVLHSVWVMPHFSQRKRTRSPAVRDAHGTVSIVLSSIW
jgi:hypothetical protein